MAITAMNMVKQGGSDPHSTMTLNEEQLGSQRHRGAPRFNTRTRRACREGTSQDKDIELYTDWNPPCVTVLDLTS